MERRLGRGLEALLGASTDPTPTETAGQVAPDAPFSLPIVKVRPNPAQPRKVFETGALEELRASIQRHGVLQPICVRKAARGFEIVAGERRWRAARMAGLTEIPATILATAVDETMLELALVENLQRRDLDPMEKARAFQELQEAFNLTQTEIAERVGMKRATVANHLRLLDLPGDAQEAVVAQLITMGHAKALLSLGSADSIRSALAKTVRDELSVRQLEQHVKSQTASPKPQTEDGPTSQGGRIPPWVRDLEARMRDQLGTRVSLQNRSGYKGQIVIRYHDRAELDRLCSLLAPKDELE